MKLKKKIIISAIVIFLMLVVLLYILYNKPIPATKVIGELEAVKYISISTYNDILHEEQKWDLVTQEEIDSFMKWIETMRLQYKGRNSISATYPSAIYSIAIHYAEGISYINITTDGSFQTAFSKFLYKVISEIQVENFLVNDKKIAIPA